MLFKLTGLALCIVLTLPAMAQNRTQSTVTTTNRTMPVDASVLHGKWTYRSYITSPAFDDNKRQGT